MDDGIYIGLLRVTDPWIIYQVHSARSEHVWFDKIAILPGDYKLTWQPSEPYNNVRAWTKAMPLAKRFQGKEIAFNDRSIEDYRVITNEHDVAVAVESGPGRWPYHFMLDIAVVTIGWSRGVLKVPTTNGAMDAVHEYREGKFEIVEGATL